jgi:hypothetical protein
VDNSVTEPESLTTPPPLPQANQPTGFANKAERLLLANFRLDSLTQQKLPIKQR